MLYYNYFKKNMFGEFLLSVQPMDTLDLKY